jgi:hypothetical protein
MNALILIGLILLFLKLVFPKLFVTALILGVLAGIGVFAAVIIGMILRDPKKEAEEMFEDDES